MVQNAVGAINDQNYIDNPEFEASIRAMMNVAMNVAEQNGVEPLSALTELAGQESYLKEQWTKAGELAEANAGLTQDYTDAKVFEFENKIPGLGG